jgi:hypothetical protein
MAGGYAMNSCQPQSCDPYSLKGGMHGAYVRGQIMWLDGYVLRSPLMEYFGKIVFLLCISMNVSSQYLITHISSSNNTYFHKLLRDRSRLQEGLSINK